MRGGGAYSALILSLLWLCVLQRVSTSSPVSGTNVPLSPALFLASESGKRKSKDTLVKVCSSFGFVDGGEQAGAVYRKLSECLAGQIEEEMLAVSRASNADLLRLGGCCDLVVGYVHATELKAGGHALLASIASLLEGIIIKGGQQQQHATRLLILVGGRESGGEEGLEAAVAEAEGATTAESSGSNSSSRSKYEALVRELVAEAWQGTAYSVRSKTNILELDDVLQVIVCKATAADVKDQVKVAIDAWPSTRTGPQVAAHIESLSAPLSEEEQAWSKKSNIEVRAASVCSGLAESFLSKVEAQLLGINNAALTVADVVAALNVAVEAAAAEQATVLAAYANTDAMRAASFRARAGLSSLLHLPFRRIIDFLYAKSLLNFEGMAKRVPSNSKINAALGKRAKMTHASFAAAAEKVRKDFAALVCDTREDYFLFSRSLARGSKQQYSTASLASSFCITSEEQRLQSDLHEATEERVRNVFLLGTYNPYLREVPWSPFHINFNYLIDPRAMALGLDYDKLYDEQVDGPATNRADAIRIPGVARVAFDPNDHPVPVNKKPWYQALVDLYRDDE